MEKSRLYCITCDICYSTNFQNSLLLEERQDHYCLQKKTGLAGQVINIFRVRPNR